MLYNIKHIHWDDMPNLSRTQRYTELRLFLETSAYYVAPMTQTIVKIGQKHKYNIPPSHLPKYMGL